MHHDSNTDVVRHTCRNCGVVFDHHKNSTNKFCSYACSIESKRRPLAERFWPKVRKTETCWEWTGARVRGGYGKIILDGHLVPAHRVSWELHYGPVPEGMLVLHNCPGVDNKWCVNPLHLRLGSKSDNATDAVKKGTWPKARLTPRQVVDIRARYAMGGVTQLDLANAYGVSHGTINNVLCSRFWKHVT